MKIRHCSPAITVSVLVWALLVPALSATDAQPITDAQIATLTPVPPSLVPRSGSFFSRSHPEWPPLPAPQSPTLPIYRLPDSSSDYLVDDTSLPPPPPANAPAAARSLLNQQSLASQQRLAAPMLDNSGLPSIPGLTNPPPPVTNYPPQLLDSPPPTNGTFWMLAETNWPPFPIDPCSGADVWLLDDGTYLVNDTGWSWPLPSGDGGGTPNSPGPAYGPQDLWLELTGVTNSTACLTLHGTTSGAAYTILTSWSPTGPWNAELPLTGADQVTPFMADTCGRKRLFFRAQVGTVTPQFLWLQALGVTNGYYNLIVHGTSGSGDSLYDILSTGALTRTNNWNNWAVETNFPAAPGQYWTPVSIPLSGRPNLFLAARSWVSSTGSGIPDWWLLQYLLPINTDPYSLCLWGDGWTFLEAYRNGWDPRGYYTPPAPRGLTVKYHAAANSASVSWEPSPGGVTGYLLQRYDPASNVTNSFWLSANANSFEDSTINQTPSSQWFGAMTYRLQAQYGSNGSGWTPWVPLYLQDPSGAAWLQRGPQGLPYLVVAGLPEWASTVDVVWVDTGSLASTNWVLPASVFTNGAYPVPDYWVPAVPGSGIWYLDVLDSNGILRDSILAYVGAESPYYGPAFFDGRAQLQQNLTFLLRAANANWPFEFALNGAGTSHPFHDCPATYAYASFYHFDEDPDYTYTTLDEFRPFDDNYLFRNFAFTTGDMTNSGNLGTGAGWDGTNNYYTLQYPPKYLFQPPATVTNIDPVLSPTDLPWTYFRPYHTTDTNELALIGITCAGTNYTMAGYAQNLFGLQFQSAQLANGVQTSTLNAGRTIPDNGGILYPATAQPILSTEEVLFRPN